MPKTKRKSNRTRKDDLKTIKNLKVGKQITEVVLALSSLAWAGIMTVMLSGLVIWTSQHKGLPIAPEDMQMLQALVGTFAVTTLGLIGHGVFCTLLEDKQNED